MIDASTIKVGDTIKYRFPHQRMELGKVINISKTKLVTKVVIFMFQIDNRDGIVFCDEVIGVIAHV